MCCEFEFTRCELRIEIFNFRIEKLYLYRRDFLFYFFLMSEFIQRYKIWVQRTEPDRLENSNVKIIANGIKIILYRWHHQPRDWVNRFDRSNIKINKLSGYEFWEAHLFGTIIFRVLFCCSHLGRNVSVLVCSSVFFFRKLDPLVKSSVMIRPLTRTVVLVCSFWSSHCVQNFYYCNIAR